MNRQIANVSAALRASARVDAISASGTNAVSQKVRDFAAKGISVINMGGGDPDFPTPEYVVDAALRSSRRGATHYVDARGLLDLRQAIADKLAQKNHIEVVPDTGIIVTPGAK